MIEASSLDLYLNGLEVLPKNEQLALAKEADVAASRKYRLLFGTNHGQDYLLRTEERLRKKGSRKSEVFGQRKRAEKIDVQYEGLNFIERSHLACEQRKLSAINMMQPLYNLESALYKGSEDMIEFLRDIYFKKLWLEEFENEVMKTVNEYATAVERLRDFRDQLHEEDVSRLSHARGLKVLQAEVDFYQELTGIEQKHIKSFTEEVEECDRIITSKRNTIVEANMKFVVSVVKGFQSSALSIEDLISVGNEALIVSVERFDYRRGFTVPSFAAKRIKGSVYDLIAETNYLTVVPGRVSQHIGKVMNRKRQLEFEGVEAAPELLAKEFRLEKGQVRDALHIGTHPTFQPTLDYNGANSKGIQTSETIPDATYDFSELTSQKQLFERMLEGMRDRDLQVLHLLYGIGCRKHNVREAGKILGISHARVGQIHQRVMKRLKRVAKTVAKGETMVSSAL